MNDEIQRSIGRLEGELEATRRAFEIHTASDRESFSQLFTKVNGIDRNVVALCTKMKLAEEAGGMAGRRAGALAGAGLAGFLVGCAKMLEALL